MIIRSEKFQDICSKILPAVDSNETSTLSTTLELITENKVLYINVTNREYYVQVKLNLDEDIDFHATVNANLFLKLISQITTDTIELAVDETNIKIKGNGNYKLPLIYDNTELLKLPKIEIINETSSFNIKSEVLKSILQYNSKELTKGVASQPVQKLYYVDECGAITFTSGACVNNFTLDAPVKLLFNNRLVKLFKLFDADNVKFTLGYDEIAEDIIQTKVRFETDGITISAILSCDDTLLKRVPVAAIRSRANVENYPYSITANKELLLQAINRLSLFSSGIGGKEIIKPYITMEFSKDNVVIYDVNKENKETLFFDSGASNFDSSQPYEVIIDLTELKTTLETCAEAYLNINFGDDSAIVISRQNIHNVIPQCSLH